MDTISYNLHNINKYPILLEFVKHLEKSKAVAKLDITDSSEILDELRKTSTYQKLYETAYINFATDKIFFASYSAKAEIPSYAFGIVINYNAMNEYIKFEFSIPKYLYHNNVVEMLPPLHSKWHPYTDSIYDVAKWWFHLIKELLPKIVEELTFYTAEKIDLSDVQIARFDIAFNQIHKSLQDARYYLESQKRLKPRMIDENNLMRDASGIWFNSSTGYHYKIYLKGPEFEKKGIPQIENALRQARKNKKQIPETLQTTYDYLPELKEWADKLLRYEFECHAKFMSYLYDKYLKKSKLEINGVKIYHQIRKDVERLTKYEEDYFLFRNLKYKYYDYVNKKVVRSEPFGNYVLKYYIPSYEGLQITSPEFIQLKKQGNIRTEAIRPEYIEVTNPATIQKIELLRNAYKRLNKYGIDNLQKLHALKKFLDQEQNKVTNFFLELPKDENITEWQIQNFDTKIFGVKPNLEAITTETDKKQLFTFKLFKLAIKKAMEIYSNFQMQNLPTTAHIKKLAIERNKKIDLGIYVTNDGKKPKKINPNSIAMWAELLKHSTYNEIKRNSHLSEWSFYYKKRILNELLGLEKDTKFITSENYNDLPKDPLTLYYYHYFHIQTGNTPISEFIQNNADVLII